MRHLGVELAFRIKFEGSPKPGPLHIHSKGVGPGILHDITRKAATLRKEKNQTIGTLKYCFSRNSLKTKDRIQNNRDAKGDILPHKRKLPHRFLFRLEPAPTLCFLQLTKILNEPMFRLDKGGAPDPSSL
jgi:hypothetical protein